MVKNIVNTLEHCGYTQYTDTQIPTQYDYIRIVYEVQKTYKTFELYFIDGRACTIVGFIKYDLQ